MTIVGTAVVLAHEDSTILYNYTVLYVFNGSNMGSCCMLCVILQGKRVFTIDQELTKILSNYKTLEDFRVNVSCLQYRINPLQTNFFSPQQSSLRTGPYVAHQSGSDHQAKLTTDSSRPSTHTGKREATTVTKPQDKTGLHNQSTHSRTSHQTLLFVHIACQHILKF